MIRHAFAQTALTSALALTAAVSLAATNVVPVSERMAAENQPLGVRAGSFLIIPKVDAQVIYDDNIFATNSDEESDVITRFKPQVDVQSNWNRHALNATARGSISRYVDNSDEDTEDYLVGADGRLDILRDTSVGGGLSFARDHEDRGDPNTPSSAEEPTEFYTTTGRIGLYRGLGRANARFDSEIRDYDYDNNTTTAGTLINNDLRDRTHYTQTARLGYQLTPEFEPYVRGSIENRVYENKSPVNRSSNGYRASVGTTVDLSGKTKADAYVGYGRRNNEVSDDISEPIFGLGLTWNPTQLTTVLANVDRTFEETIIAGSSGYVRTVYNVGVEHALTRRLLATGLLEYSNQEYEGSAPVQRDDDVWTAALGTKYFINRCFSVGGEYRYRDRDSNLNGAPGLNTGDFSRNQFLVRLSATY